MCGSVQPAVTASADHDRVSPHSCATRTRLSAPCALPTAVITRTACREHAESPPEPLDHTRQRYGTPISPKRMLPSVEASTRRRPTACPALKTTPRRGRIVPRFTIRRAAERTSRTDGGSSSVPAGPASVRAEGEVIVQAARSGRESPRNIRTRCPVTAAVSARVSARTCSRSARHPATPP